MSSGAGDCETPERKAEGFFGRSWLAKRKGKINEDTERRDNGGQS
jgi:hypothetical protein